MIRAAQQGRGIGLWVAARVGLLSLALWLLALLWLSRSTMDALWGVALGGGLTLFFLALHLALAWSWLRPGRRRSARLYLWFLWLVKWPLVGLILYRAVTTGWANPIWLCIGAAVVPAAATAYAVALLPWGTAAAPLAEGTR